MIVKRVMKIIVIDDVFLSHVLDQITLAAELFVKILYTRSDQIHLFKSTNDDLH